MVRGKIKIIKYRNIITIDSSCNMTVFSRLICK